MNTIIKNTGRLIVLLLMVLTTQQLSAMGEAELKKLLNAHRTANRVFAKTKNASGAVFTLKEAGVELLAKGRPPLMSNKDYLDVLESYANYLAYTKGGGDEAAKYLKLVIKTDSSRVSAYLYLGRLYRHRFESEKNPQFKRIYKRSFEKYVQGLLDNAVTTVLEEDVAEVVYPYKNDICALLVGLNQSSRLTELRYLFNPERDVKTLTAEQQAKLSGELGASFLPIKQTAQGSIRQSQVDVDNDGELESRFVARTGGGCQRNVFYKHFGPQSVLLSNQLLDEYYQPNRICGEVELYPVRYGRVNYLVEHRYLEQGRGNLTVHEVRSSGEAINRCQVSPPTALQRNLKQQCAASVCNAIAAKIDKLASTDGQMGVEWLVSDIISLQFADDVINDVALDAFINSEHQYLADIDNDSEPELISRVWSKRDDGNLHYQHRLFRKVAGKWQRWKWPPAVQNTGETIPDDVWLFVEQHANKNYVVSYAVSESRSPTTGKRRLFKLNVFLVEAAVMKKVGSIHTYLNLAAP